VLLKTKMTISGRVQGVFYRQSTQKMARSLALVGWVRNLPDGQVELEAFGSAEALERLRQWCELGPPAAQVISVQVISLQPVEEIPFRDFEIH
jgi:acylphosphatase